MTTTIITPALVQALRACNLLRRDDPTYCNKHRAAADKRAAKKAEWRRMDRARRRAAA